jgi:Bifunctional DNA primase/polymerase, N-terminal
MTITAPGQTMHPLCEDDQDGASAAAGISGRQLREFAHRYLEEGLWPVPAWGARPDGGCCCPRGADCPRSGKHPRSVHAGPGPRDYSWKPLACRTHAEVDQRLAPGGRYAAGNLMVAIPPGMMAIDRDDDDGGRIAIAELAGELGELPPTLAHRTPHGEHLIYRTPAG